MWPSLTQKIAHCSAGEPSGELKSAIEKDFGSFEEFKKQFSTAGATQFGSGWAWLVKDGGKLKVNVLHSCLQHLLNDSHE